MICKNCGTENPDDSEYCKKCGKVFVTKKYKIYWLQTGVGSIAGLMILFIFYTLWGSESMFYIGTIPSVMLSGALAAILSYNKNLKISQDINPLFQGIISGSITGLILLITMATINTGLKTIFLSLLIGCVVWSFVGSSIGIMINLIREKDKRLLIPTFIIIMVIIIGLGYFITATNSNNNFQSALSNQIMILELDDLLEKDADSLLKNASYSNDNNSNLKQAQGTYQKMIEITSNAVLWNKELIASSTSETQKEYSKQLGKYTELKLKYYKTTKQGIDLQIQGKTTEAEVKYREAEKMIPQIKNQEKIINETLKKDPQLENLIKTETESSKRYVTVNKDEVVTYTFELLELN